VPIAFLHLEFLQIIYSHRIFYCYCCTCCKICFAYADCRLSETEQTSSSAAVSAACVGSV